MIDTYSRCSEKKKQLLDKIGQRVVDATFDACTALFIDLKETLRWYSLACALLQNPAENRQKKLPKIGSSRSVVETTENR